MSKNTQIVYYAKQKDFDLTKQKSFINEIATLPLEPLTKEVKTVFKDKGCDLAIRCYAVQDEIKNTFVYKSPFDLDVIYGEDKRIIVKPENVLNQGVNVVQFTPDLDGSINGSLVQLFTNYGFYFFSEQPLKLSIQTPNFHDSKIKHIPLLTGEYDIAKWFRPVFPSYANYNYENFSMKRGDAMMYIKFNTDKKVVLKEFCMNRELDNLVTGSLDLKSVMPWVPLDRLYKMFLANNMNKKVLKQIKNQVV